MYMVLTLTKSELSTGVGKPLFSYKLIMLSQQKEMSHLVLLCEF